MKSLSFEPKVLKITKGQSVVWKNVALTEHTATSENTPPTFDTGLIEPKHESKKIVFNEVGDFKYHCSVHGKTMSGVVSVQPGQP
jgi:plastocyanin